MGGNAPKKLRMVPNETMPVSQERSLAEALSGSLQPKAAELFALMSAQDISTEALDDLIREFNDLGVAQIKEGAFATLAEAQIPERTFRLVGGHELVVNRSARGITTLKRAA